MARAQPGIRTVTVTLRELLDDGRVHVVDGAMGTMLYGRGVFVNVCYDELNLQRPELVQEVHEEYVRAGAEILETNTFGANPVKLSSYGLDEQTEEINRAAGELARLAAAGRASVVGALGPLGIRLEPFGPTAFEEAAAYFGRQVAGLLDGGVDGFCLETFSDLRELEAGVHALRQRSDLPVMAQITVGENAETSYGTSVEAAAAALNDWGVDIAGINCSVGPAIMLDAVERLVAATELPISAQPNAGLPRVVDDRKIYLASPEYMGQYARRMIEAGARFVGGCCGTTPDHVRKIRDHVASVQPRHVLVRPEGSPEDRARGESVPLAKRSSWGRKLETGEFVTSVEITPPRGWNTQEMFGQCRKLRVAGVDAAAVLDGSRARTRMGALPAAMLIEAEVGVEPLAHYTCRDRNMLGMISDLLGAAAGGLKNMLIVSGDPTSLGPYGDSTAVYDIDSIGLVNVVDRLNRGADPGGNDIGGATEFVIGVALNQGAVDQDLELRRFGWKVEAGAHFAVTQPVFDPAQLATFLGRVDGPRIPIVAGLWPLTSLRNAEFLANEVPGIEVPDRVVERMRSVQDRGAAAARAEGLAIAREVFEEVRDLVQGVQISLPGGDVDRVLELLESVAGR